VDLTVANAVLLATQNEASKTDIDNSTGQEKKHKKTQ
jgi:hypothetical protein